MVGWDDGGFAVGVGGGGGVVVDDGDGAHAGRRGRFGFGFDFDFRRAGGVSPLILHPVADTMRNQGADAPRSPGERRQAGPDP